MGGGGVSSPGRTIPTQGWESTSYPPDSREKVPFGCTTLLVLKKSFEATKGPSWPRRFWLDHRVSKLIGPERTFLRRWQMVWISTEKRPGKVCGTKKWKGVPRQLQRGPRWRGGGGSGLRPNGWQGHLPSRRKSARESVRAEDSIRGGGVSGFNTRRVVLCCVDVRWSPPSHSQNLGHVLKSDVPWMVQLVCSHRCWSHF